MDNGHIYILQYIHNLEEQVLADNYAVGRELVRDKATVKHLIDWLFHAKTYNDMAYRGYETLKQVVPEQKYGIEWINEGKQIEGEQHA